MMRKISGIIGGLFLYLSLTNPAFAQAGVFNLCPEGSEFRALCGLTADRLPMIIQLILSLILGLAVILALFFLIWGAIKWIVSGGDKAAVEAARNTIIAALVGLIIAILAFFILAIVGKLFGINFLQFTLPTIV